MTRANHAHARQWTSALGSLIFVSLVGGAAVAAAAEAPIRKAGDILVDQSGMTLYVFDKDSPGKSACYAKCAALWPPLMAGANAVPSGPYTVIVRDDGTRQWAYKGRPLYLWVKDQKPGERTGDGVNGVWHVVRD